jgi:hypothetical protein
VNAAELFDDLLGLSEAAIVAHENFNREIVSIMRADARKRLA